MYSEDKYFQLLKGRQLIVQVERKHTGNHFRNHFLPDVIVNMNSPQILSQDILSGRRMLRPLEHHLLRVLNKTNKGSCCLTFAHAQFFPMATDNFAWCLIALCLFALYLFALCLFALCLFALCLFALCLFALCLFTLCLFALCLFALCLYAFCLFALCLFALSLFALCLLPLSMPFCILTSSRCMIPETGFCPSVSIWCIPNLKHRIGLLLFSFGLMLVQFG